jgi:hypothetical protein
MLFFKEFIGSEFIAQNNVRNIYYRQHRPSQRSKTVTTRRFHADPLAVVVVAFRVDGRRLRLQSGAHFHRCSHRNIFGHFERPHSRRFPARSCQKCRKIYSGFVAVKE